MAVKSQQRLDFEAYERSIGFQEGRYGAGDWELWQAAQAKMRKPAPAGSCTSECDNCKYRTLPYSGGHCYMFRDEPNGMCMQFTRYVPIGGAKK